ncbi:hypothetical protein Tco_0939102 [Tanacetum coccineum]|uniref:Reverse transcriptase/retrotransposon-derived protein RNase H-like domain-containing protein n=1 Tax=Tanacetum coccineum TaxID=301880 RepID=A0ABQ5DJN3_9ASTR
MDEFCGGKTTISVQWDHMKANGEENSSSPVNSSRNVKFPVPGGILTLRSSRIIPLECTMVSGPEAQPSPITQAAEERIKVAIHPEYPEQTIAIGSTLTKEGRKALGFTTPSRASPERPRKLPSSQTKEKKPSIEKEQGNTRGSSKTYRRRNNEGSLLLMAYNRHLQSYFITDLPIKEGLSNQNAEIQNWSIELGEYDIQYMPRTSVKGQILAEFTVECPKDDSLATTMEVEEELPDPWTLFSDGSSCIDGSGAGLILTKP